MTAKEKAKELYEKMYLLEVNGRGCWMFKVAAKKCALIAADELIKYSTFHSNKEAKWNPKEECRDYWQEVKQEIELLKI